MHHRGRMTGVSKGGNELAFGEYGIQALEPGWITARQIEAARIAMTRHIKRGGKVWINVFPDKSVTKKPAETRMGSGKGNPELWVAVVKPGRIIVPSAPGVGTASPRQTSVNAASRTVPTRAAAAKGKPMASPKAPGLRSIASSKAMDEFHGRLAGIKHEVDEVNHKLDVFEQKTK